MPKLSKDIFVESITEALQKEGINVEKTRVKNVNNIYDGIKMSTMEKGAVTPVINTDAIYNDYVNNIVSLTKVINDISKIFKENADDKSVDYIQRLNNFEYVKNNLVIEVYGANKNKELIEDNLICQKYEDLVIVPKVIVGSFNDKNLLCSIPIEFIKEYGISKEEFMLLAIHSSERLRPLNIMNMQDMIVDEYAEYLIKLGEQASKNDIMKRIKNDPHIMNKLFPNNYIMYIVSNQNIQCGAASIFYTGVLDKLYANIGKFYILPSSIHEMLIAPCDKIPDTDSSILTELVESVNNDKNVIEDKDILSNSVYLYDGKKMCKV